MARKTSWQLFWQDKGAVFAAVILLLIILCITLAPLIAPYDPIETNLMNRLSSPSRDHLLGADEMGRDILSRILYGGRYTLITGILVVLIGLGIGGLLGILAGYYPQLGNMIMRPMDVLMSFPAVLIAMAIVGIMGAGLWSVMVAVGISNIPKYVRLTQGSTLSVKEMEFMTASHALGASTRRILLCNIIPHIFAPIVVYATLNLGFSILIIAALSFLGLGIQPPTPEWGAMVATGRSYLYESPHVTTFPSLAIFFTVLCVNYLGDRMRDIFDPRLR